MKKSTYHAKAIQEYLQQNKVAALNDLKTVLGTTVSMTVFRKLKQLGYFSSCSHRGKYYTLERIARFDKSGLWRVGTILFSKQGTLLDTVENFVLRSAAGYTAAELRSTLSIEVKESLLQLWTETRIARLKIDGQYVYTSAEASQKRQQVLFRRQRESANLGSSFLSKVVKAALVLFYSLLNERQRRLFAGLESIKQGHGGDKHIAQLLGINAHTVAKGREELLRGDSEINRIRHAGGGRNAVKKNSGGDSSHRTNHEA